MDDADRSGDGPGNEKAPFAMDQAVDDMGDPSGQGDQHHDDDNNDEAALGPVIVGVDGVVTGTAEAEHGIEPSGHQGVDMQSMWGAGLGFSSSMSGGGSCTPSRMCRG